MSHSGEYKTWADEKKNRLYIVLKGFMPDDMVKTAADEVVAATKRLRPGFAVINDISEMKPATQAGALEIRRAQEFLKERGVARVIRIVKTENTLTGVQFNRKSSDLYKADTAVSVAEAEGILDASGG
jgi:hypothetical protein